MGPIQNKLVNLAAIVPLLGGEPAPLQPYIPLEETTISTSHSLQESVFNPEMTRCLIELGINYEISKARRDYNDLVSYTLSYYEDPNSVLTEKHLEYSRNTATMADLSDPGDESPRLCTTLDQAIQKDRPVSSPPSPHAIFTSEFHDRYAAICDGLHQAIIELSLYEVSSEVIDVALLNKLTVAAKDLARATGSLRLLYLPSGKPPGTVSVPTYDFSVLKSFGLDILNTAVTSTESALKHSDGNKEPF